MEVINFDERLSVWNRKSISCKLALAMGYKLQVIGKAIKGMVFVPVKMIN